MEVASLQHKLAVATGKAEAAAAEALRTQRQLGEAQVVLEDLVRAVTSLAERLDESGAVAGVTGSFQDVARSTQATLKAVGSASSGLQELVELQAQAHAAFAAPPMDAEAEALLMGAGGLPQLAEALKEMQGDAQRQGEGGEAWAQQGEQGCRGWGGLGWGGACSGVDGGGLGWGALHTHGTNRLEQSQCVACAQWILLRGWGGAGRAHLGVACMPQRGKVNGPTRAPIGCPQLATSRACSRWHLQAAAGPGCVARQ